MTVVPAQVFRRQRIEKSLNEALSRLAGSRHTKDPADSFAALGEVLGYIVKLDDWHMRIEGADYKKMRDSDAVGEFVIGFRHARNLLEHHLSVTDLVDVTDGVQFPIQWPMSFHEVRWKRLTDLPRQNRKHKHVEEEAYAKHLQDKPVRLTVSEIAEFFKQI